MTLKHIPLIVCALAALSLTAHAQFTAAVVPPKAKAKVDTVAKQDSVRRATVALAARVTDMKRWVDSAAGVPLPPESDSTSAVASATDTTVSATKDSVILNRNERVRADSASSIATVEVHDSTGLKADSAAATSPNRPASSRRRTPRETTRYTAGAPAPDTASALPLLALIAGATLLAGVALRRP
jgi:CCR4-NOT transcriptional regulation complex NOT5 subunit